jgi:predicted transcriptional regulator
LAVRKNLSSLRADAGFDNPEVYEYLNLPALIKAIHAALTRLRDGAETPPEEQTKAPAVAIRKSITPEYLVCLEDGKRFKSLKRHLAKHGLTPQQYRAKWELPLDYPTVAPNYAAVRSALATKIGLGQNRKGAKNEPAWAQAEAAGTSVGTGVTAAR